MKFIESLMVSLNGVGIVFLVLVGISGLLTIQGRIVKLFDSKVRQKIDLNDGSIEKKLTPNNQSKVSFQNSETASHINNGELRLIGVDEKTAAIIMAIVSDESQIPLSQLNFKSIRAID